VEKTELGFTVEQDCPQCGAPVELDEADHLMHCPFCEVDSFLYTPNYLRFALPLKAPAEEVLYAPYLRFKGNVFYFTESTMGHRIVDITHVGMPIQGLPVSLGLRPQAMKMKYVAPDIQGSFLRFSLDAKEILEQAGNVSTPKSSGQLLHRAYIGETLSLIYLPLYVEKERIFDGVLKRPIPGLAQGPEPFRKAIHRNPRWELAFLPTLCPNCGWNLQGEHDSVVLTCPNCESAWEALDGKFQRVRSGTMEGGGGAYLPFWRMSVTVTGLPIHSFADFVRITNQPKAANAKWEQEPMSFWSPAFKIRPKTFARLARQFTVSQPFIPTEDKVPKEEQHPVTLPRTEAMQSMKLTLAHATVNKKDVLPYLPRLKFHIHDTRLIWLPFEESAHDFIHKDLNISVNKSSLTFGRKL
jgi:hypothetical protein